MATAAELVMIAKIRNSSLVKQLDRRAEIKPVSLSPKKLLLLSLVYIIPQNLLYRNFHFLPQRSQRTQRSGREWIISVNSVFSVANLLVFFTDTLTGHESRLN